MFWQGLHQWIMRFFQPLTLGERGERLAEKHYRRQGCKVLAQNWRAGIDELDLVVLEGEVLVFVEVKTRTADWGGAGYRAVNHRKKRAIRRAAMAWLRQIRGVRHTRFDVIEVMVCQGGTVRLLQHRGIPLFRKHSL